MKAGQTNINVGAQVRIKNIKGEDNSLNGKTGTITHPFAFGCTKKGWVGIYLDAGQHPMLYGAKVNVKVSEIELL